MKKIIIVMILISQVLLSKQSKLDTNEFELFLLKASKNISVGDYKSAYANLEKSLLHNPEHYNNKLYLAIFLTGVKKYINSLSIILKTKELKNSQLAQFYTYYNYHFIQKYLEEAGLKKFNSTKEFLLKNNDKLGEDKLLFLAVSAFINSDPKSSLVFFKKAIAKNPNILSLNYQILIGKDVIYSIYKNLSPPYNSFYYNSLAKMQIGFKDEKNAIITLNKSLKIDKKDYFTKKLLSDAYISLRNYDEALKYLNQVKEFFFDREELFLSYRKVYDSKNDNKKKLEICSEGLIQLPYSKKLRFCLVEALHKEGHYQKALFNLEYLLNQSPDSSEILLLTGEVLEDLFKKLSFNTKAINSYKEILKNFSEPMDYYKKAFERNPIEPKIMKKIFKNFINKTVKDLESNVNSKNLSNEDIIEIKTLANNDYLKYYEPFAIRENLELSNIKFHKYFVKYIKERSPKMIEEMKYLPIGKTILLYIGFLNNLNNEKLFNKFMKTYSKKYFLILNKKHQFNQFLYHFKVDNQVKIIEQVKVFDFIIPSYFD